MRVRITPTIANEYDVRCPEGIPERIHAAGVCDLTDEEAAQVRQDAEYNSDQSAQDIGPDYMPLHVFNAYRALAKQFARADQAGNT